MKKGTSNRTLPIFSFCIGTRPVVHPSIAARQRAANRSHASCFNGIGQAFDKAIKKETR